MTFGIWWAHSMPSRDVNTNVVLDPMIRFIIQGLEYIWQQYSFKHLHSHVRNCRDTEANKSLNIFRTDSYSVLSPFLFKLRYAYRRNGQNMFYLLVYFKIESEIAVKSYKQYLFVLSPKIHLLLLLQFLVHHPPIKMLYLSHDLAKCPDLLSNIAFSVLQCFNF